MSLIKFFLNATFTCKNCFDKFFNQQFCIFFLKLCVTNFQLVSCSLAVPYVIEIKVLSSLIFWEFQPLENTVPYKAFLIKQNKCKSWNHFNVKTDSKKLRLVQQYRLFRVENLLHSFICIQLSSAELVTLNLFMPLLFTWQYLLSC